MEHYADLSDAVTTITITPIIISIKRAGAVKNGEATVEVDGTMRHTLAWTDSGDVMRQHRIAVTEVKPAEHDGQMKREIDEEERLRYFSDMVISTQANSTNEMTMNP
jgi:hypothetical protein